MMTPERQAELREIYKQEESSAAHSILALLDALKEAEEQWARMLELSGDFVVGLAALAKEAEKPAEDSPCQPWRKLCHRKIPLASPMPLAGAG